MSDACTNVEPSGEDLCIRQFDSCGKERYRFKRLGSEPQTRFDGISRFSEDMDEAVVLSVTIFWSTLHSSAPRSKGVVCVRDLILPAPVVWWDCARAATKFSIVY